MAVENDPKQYVTLHGSVFRKIILDIVECVRERGWSEAEVEEAIKGAFVTVHGLGGTANSIAEFSDALMAKSGSPPEATKH